MGTITMYRHLALCLLIVLAPIVVAVPATATSSPSPAATISDAECETKVVHDAFRHDETTIDAAENDSVTTTESNTDVTVDTNVAFARLEAENPNGYCVTYVVEISPEVIDPADLGSIGATDGDETATWRAIHDFGGDETYTKVEFTLGGGESSTFAPSQLRVRSLKWAGEAKNTSSGLLPDLSALPFVGDDEEGLEQRHYEFSAENDSDSVSIALSNESLGQEIEDYQAMYRVGDGDLKPIDSDSDAPVFSRELDGGQVVEFTFNDADAEVKFIAEPNMRERASYQWNSYWSGMDSVRDLIPLSTTSTLQTVMHT